MGLGVGTSVGMCVGAIAVIGTEVAVKTGIGSGRDVEVSIGAREGVVTGEQVAINHGINIQTRKLTFIGLASFSFSAIGCRSTELVSSSKVKYSLIAVPPV